MVDDASIERPARLYLTRVLAGPFARCSSATMGADVIKIGRAVEGDDARGWAPFVGVELYFVGAVQQARAWRSIFSPRGARAIGACWRQRMCSSKTVPGSLDKLGSAGTPTMRAIRLIHCSIRVTARPGPAYGI